MCVYQGFVLIVVLLFLQIFSLLGLDAIEASWIEEKLSRLSWQKYTMTVELEEALKQVEQNISDFSPECFIPTLSSETFIDKPFSWWQERSCTGNFQSIQYYYVVESLGIDPCAHIKDSEDVADYYRVTFLGMRGHGEDRLLIQTIMVKANKPSDVCRGSLYQLEKGRQSWREVVF